MSTAQEILQQHWGYGTFRGEQENIIRAVMEDKDVLALMPTGGGKSLCFQVPALMKEGICLVISPLIALIKDQADNLRKRDIPVAALHSGMSYYEVRQTLQQAAHGDYKFLYLSPERLETSLFREYLHALNVSIIAVDEAHCISQWGYDFRPPYLRIANLREELPDVPIIALTASATNKVKDDIIDKLQLQQAAVFRQSFERSNVSFSVFNTDSKINKAIEVLTNVAGSAIIYCRNRKQTKQVAELLQLQNITADFYHAGLQQEERSKKQAAWINNEIRVMVCTNAFGMGIDKPDVRAVIHYDVPDCIENYYQEAGRAGRDGKKAYAVLLYHVLDIAGLEALPDMRFPAIQTIRQVYQSIADYLHIPVGIGQGNYYDFDLFSFCKNFSLDLLMVINVLKVLEQEGHIVFSESIFLPSQVMFTAEKSLLEDIEQTHPELEPVMKCLLRTYVGIYDNRVSVNEKNIARLCRLPYERIYTDLQTLQAYGIIEYLPQKDTPQLHFVLNRAPAESLYINHEQYLQRKKLYSERVQSMIAYMRLTTECRSKFIATYFGDVDAKDCGVCDNCLSRKSKALTPQMFNQLKEQILAAIPVNGISIHELMSKLGKQHKEEYWQALDFMQAEKLVIVDAAGNVQQV